ncbi:hypothetical protein NDU88_001886 [Pleurodeles waltl]|uniref:Uncharacterized protein n=1 Tax=Pleurodeles waltl TaxID=8319 RepID=A0AAV7SB40_PLEWA|nr:hypothetical protein NDU88_001886 [Pleurodeles waltl]
MESINTSAKLFPPRVEDISERQLMGVVTEEQVSQQSLALSARPEKEPECGRSDSGEPGTHLGVKGVEGRKDPQAE